jgi:hypothetical protein
VVNIAVDPTDGTRVYVAALNDGLFRSDDSGQTFTKIAPGTEEVWAVGVGGADGKTVYYATNSGAFWQSTDRGQTWTQRPSTPQNIYSRRYFDGQLRRCASRPRDKRKHRRGPNMDRVVHR